jgi:hypothetical protein
LNRKWRSNGSSRVVEALLAKDGEVHTAIMGVTDSRKHCTGTFDDLIFKIINKVREVPPGNKIDLINRKAG